MPMFFPYSDNDSAIDWIAYSLDEGANITTLNFTDTFCFQEQANIAETCGAVAGGNYSVSNFASGTNINDSSVHG